MGSRKVKPEPEDDESSLNSAVLLQMEPKHDSFDCPNLGSVNKASQSSFRLSMLKPSCIKNCPEVSPNEPTIELIDVKENIQLNNLKLHQSI